MRQREPVILPDYEILNRKNVASAVILPLPFILYLQKRTFDHTDAGCEFSNSIPGEMFLVV